MHPAAVALAVLLWGATPALAGEPLTLEAALAEAAARAPGVEAARAREDVARGDVEVARTFAPLTLGLAAGQNDPRWSVGLSQRLPVPGARGARVRAAELTVRSAEGERRGNASTVRADARKAYFSLVQARRLAENAALALSLALESEEAARLRFETGAAPELDLVQARLARASAEVQVLTRRGDLAALSAELALLLGRDPLRTLEPVEARPPPLPALEAVLARSGQAPLALARQADVSAAEATLRAARRERWPTPTVGASVEADGPAGRAVYLRGALDLEFPVPGLGRGEVDRAGASLRLAGALADEDQRRRSADIVAAHQRLAAALAALQRYTADILPDVETSERMALESYRTGRTGRAALNDALRAAADLRAQAAQAAFTAQAAFADLELAAGVALDGREANE